MEEVLRMKHNKKTVRGILASVLSAALLTTSIAVPIDRTPVKAASDNDYYEALALSLYMFDANACGTDVDENPLTWRGNCHTYDQYPGGYHDAGDHIKFNLTMGFAGSSLAMADYLNPGVFEKAGCKDHLIAILRRNADYLMSTTQLSGDSVTEIAHVVADGNADHAIWSSPEVQDYPRQVYKLTAGNNNSAVCGEMAAALAGTAYVVKDSDPAYAETCLKYAKALVDFGKNHVGNNKEGLNGFYDTEEQYQDEIALAEAWLWICGAGSKPTMVPEGGGKYSDGAGYDGYRYCWNKVFQGYAALMYKATGESIWSTELQTEINKQGGLRVGTYNGDGWGAARYNCALQMSGYAVANGDPNNEYATAGKWQMDYILGDNPTGYSFLIGYGDKWPTHYHHRAANPGNGDPQQNPEAKYVLYGALVGGIDASGQYEDKTDGYQYTEPAIDYNGCFVLACAGLANLYGGSDAGAKNIISGASEITYPYDFGYGSSATDPTTQTTENTTSGSEQQTTDPTKPTNPTTPSEKDADYEQVEGDGSSVQWEFKVFGAKKLVVTLKTNSSDTEATGGWGYWDDTAQEWHQVGDDNWKATPDGSGKFTVEYDVPSGLGTLQLQVWWPNSATVESAKLVFDTQQPATEAPTEPATTEATEPPTTEPTEATTTEQPTTEAPQPGNLKYGDVNEDQKITIADVIALNKYLLSADMKDVTEQGLKNADVNANNSLDTTDSLIILKCCVNLISESELPVR